MATDSEDVDPQLRGGPPAEEVDFEPTDDLRGPGPADLPAPPGDPGPRGGSGPRGPGPPPRTP
eukprot:7594731-Lingulodinium_polyedra.AAC.1